MREYLFRRPARRAAGMVLVHNHIQPIRSREAIGARGFRIWLEPPSDRLATCPCGFAPRFGAPLSPCGQVPGGVMLDRAVQPDLEVIDIDRLIRDEALQPRAGTDEATVAEYQHAMREGAKFPPVRVVETPDGALRLVDGWHRVEAAERGAYTKLYARVWTGTHDEDVEFAATCNTKHGLRRSEADLAKVVAMLVALSKWRQASNVEIAKHIGVGEATIRRVYLRHSDEDVDAISDPAQTRIVRRGAQQYPMKVARIGRAQEPAPAAESDEPVQGLDPKRLEATAEANTQKALKTDARWRMKEARIAFERLTEDEKLKHADMVLAWLAEHEKSDASEPA
jgi:hypothetical protein